MNNKGVFITFMVFLLVASMLALHDVTKKTDFKQERLHIDETAFNIVNNTFNNLYEEVVSLNKEGAAKTVQQRPMPFQYDFGTNLVIISQRVPVRKSILDAYFDALNIYSIFTNQESTSNLQISTSTLQNLEWGGTGEEYPNLQYAILPQCLSYDINNCCFDGNYMILKELGDGELGCVGGFDYADLNIVDVNISINTSGYINQVPPLTGTLSSKTDVFEPANPLPFARITINETNPQCPGIGCLITSNGKEVRSAHFDPGYSGVGSEDTLIIHADPDDYVRVKIGMEEAIDPFPVVVFNTFVNAPAYIDLNITFDQKVEQFYFTGFSIDVEKKNFAIKRST